MVYLVTGNDGAARIDRIGKPAVGGDLDPAGRCLRIRHGAADRIEGPVAILAVGRHCALACSPQRLTDFGDEQMAPGVEGKGEGSIAERVLNPVFAGSTVAIDRVSAN